MLFVDLWYLLWTFSINKPILPFASLTGGRTHVGLNVSEHGATTELLDMFRTMDSQARTGDMSLRVPVEPFTEVGQIAERYNWVMEALQREAAKTESSLQEKELLLREIHHRVKNNLQVISSLLSLQSRYRKDEQAIEMAQESQNRIKVMALIHEKLYRSKDFANVEFNDYIKNLVNDLFASYKVSTSRISLKMDIENISLGIDTAIPTGLIVNELVTNCLKYAFPNQTKMVKSGYPFVHLMMVRTN